MSLFALTDRVVVVTGATGTLTATTANYLAAQRARVVYLGRNPDKVASEVRRCQANVAGAQCLGVIADVLDRDALRRARDTVLDRWGRVDALLNGAGGNMPGATLPPDGDLDAIDVDAFKQVVDLNLHGTVLPTMVFLPALVASGRGAIINYSSAAVPQAVTRVAGYSAAKAGVENFTRWLAVEAAKRGNGVRVNALMPGFFIGEQNRRLLTDADGALTDRGRLIVQNTPMGRFGEPDELFGAVHYLLSDASKFVTGHTLVVDGGFGVFSGV